MKLYVAATGSAGNAYVLSSDDGESLILDAGVPFKRLLPGIPDYRRISACLITHEHMDHAARWAEYRQRGIHILASPGTWNCLTSETLGIDEVAMPKQTYNFGGFTVLPFETQHDAAQPIGFLIRCDKTGETTLYATDTYYLRYTFPGVNYWITECNYIEDLLTEDMEKALVERLKQSHMSLRRLRDALAANDLRETAKIVLVHLSDSRSDEKRMVEEITQDTGIETVAARAGAWIDLQRTPF